MVQSYPTIDYKPIGNIPNTTFIETCDVFMCLLQAYMI